MSLFIIVNVGATLSLLAPSPLELPVPLGAAVSGYGAALVAHPLATKGATALALSVSGDAVTQVASREPERGDSEARGEWFDARRNLGFGAFGGAYGLVQGALFDVLNESPAVAAAAAALQQAHLVSQECSGRPTRSFLLTDRPAKPAGGGCAGSARRCARQDGDDAVRRGASSPRRLPSRPATTRVRPSPPRSPPSTFRSFSPSSPPCEATLPPRRSSTRARRSGRSSSAAGPTPAPPPPAPHPPHRLPGPSHPPLAPCQVLLPPAAAVQLCPRARRMAGGADRTHSSGPPASPHPSSRPLHQVTYVSLGSFVWTCILSYASSPPPAATARGAAAECEPVMEVCEVPLEPPPGGLSTDDLLVRRRARRGAE